MEAGNEPQIRGGLLKSVIPIIYQDERLLVINKPAGIPVLPDGWDKDAPYLVKILEEQHGKLWVVHRLDKVTSGVMVFARTAEAHRALNGQFERHQAEKIYHAIALGLPEWDAHTARHPLRANVGHQHRTVIDPKTGRASETRFKVLKRYQAQVWLEARPVSGRTHQVRVHAMALGHPLLGDVLYGAPPTDLMARPALHAHSLTIKLPGISTATFSAPHPDDFENALKRLSNID